MSRLEGAKGGRVLSYAGRQLLSREIELEKLRRAEASLYRDSQPNSQRVDTPKKRDSNTLSTPKGRVILSFR